METNWMSYPSVIRASLDLTRAQDAFTSDPSAKHWNQVLIAMANYQAEVIECRETERRLRDAGAKSCPTLGRCSSDCQPGGDICRNPVPPACDPFGRRY